MHDWRRYIPFTGADEHGNQPVQNGTTGRPLRQGGSSRTIAPAAVVRAQRTGTQPCTIHLRSLWSNPSAKAQPRAFLNIWKGATSSPPTTIAGQKQLMPHPMTDLEAKVDSIQFANSPRRQRASR